MCYAIRAEDAAEAIHRAHESEHGFRSRMHNRRVHLLGTSGTVTMVAGSYAAARATEDLRRGP
mgnify:CR=1 FL=1